MSAKFVAELTWPEVEESLQAGDVAVVPIGAEAKQHGRHLPMNTDWLQARWLAKELAKLTDVLVFPIVNYTFSPAFVEFPGSVSLGQETFTRLMSDILKEIARHKPFRIVVLNTAGNTRRALDRLADHSDFRDRVIMYHANERSNIREVVEKIREQAFGSHAGEIETSKMLGIEPDVVKPEDIIPPDEAREFDFEEENRLARFDSSHPNFSPTGVYGNPALAEEKKGKRMATAMRKDLKDLVALIDEERRKDEEAAAQAVDAAEAARSGRGDAGDAASSG